MPEVVPVIAALLAATCGVVALVMLGLAASHVASGPDDDPRAAGRYLILHGAAVLVLLASLAPLAHHATAVGRLACGVPLSLWAVTAMVAGLALTRRPGRQEPPDEDGGTGGGGGGDDPDPTPPWWPQFERDLADWQADRERVPALR